MLECILNKWDDILLILTLVVFPSYVVLLLFLNDRATTQITEFWEYWKAILERSGYKITENSYYDDASCSTTYTISNSGLNVILPSRKTLRVLRDIRDGKSISYLKKYNEWPFTKLPK